MVKTQTMLLSLALLLTQVQLQAAERDARIFQKKRLLPSSIRRVLSRQLEAGQRHQYLPLKYHLTIQSIEAIWLLTTNLV